MSDNLVSRLRVLKQLYDEQLITRDEYDTYRLREIDNWFENNEDERSIWRKLWDKAREFGSIFLRTIIRPIAQKLGISLLEPPRNQ
ncbi:hypothetical protein C1645_829524 [Glomus cerebriforme]|uniref:Uncharacterized protein n=1 Tax=Glomus cerebriforme TaxID=658196 RepID=A0A397STR1_9GLOM|nr:hypothetical protein C1645_829524 [Glomus cerebriforme]